MLFRSDQRLLEFAQYTRPREYRGLEVPSVLVSGNHEEVARWRAENSRERTRRRRADLLLPEQPGSSGETRRDSESGHEGVLEQELSESNRGDRGRPSSASEEPS